MKKIMNNKLLKKIATIMQILILLLPTKLLLAADIVQEEQITIEKEELNCPIDIQFWNEETEEWTNIQCSKTYYIDNNGNKNLAYDVNLEKLKELTSQTEENDNKLYKLTNEKILRIIENSYPNVTLENLGVNTEDEAYLVTNLAIKWVLEEKNIDEIYKHFRTVDNQEETLKEETAEQEEALKEETAEQEEMLEEETAEQEKMLEEETAEQEEMLEEETVGQEEISEEATEKQDEKFEEETVEQEEKFDEEICKENEIIDAIYKLVNIAYNAENQPVEELKIIEKSNFVQDENAEYYSKIYQIPENNINIAYKITQINNAPKNTFISNINGEEQTTFNCGENFKIMVPKANIDNDYNITINYCRQTNLYSAYYTKSSSQQNYIVLVNEPKEEKEGLALNIDGHMSNLQIIETDEDTGEPIEGIKLTVESNSGEIKGTYTTDKNGIISITKLPQGQYTIRENSTNEKYILDTTEKEVKLNYNETTQIKIENKKIKGQIKILTTSQDKNNILNIEAGTPIENAKFNIYNENSELMEQISTDKNGIAITKKLEKGKYFIQEIETGKWYMIDNQKYNAQISTNNEVVELNITNKSQNPKVEIEKTYNNTVKTNGEIDYAFEIKNTGNTELTDFTWYEIIPNDYSKITKISTGTFNQETNYSIYYKTNQKDEYTILMENINSKENTQIDLTNINLEENERITEIKIYFEKIGSDFSNIERTHIYMQASKDLEDNAEIKNYTIIEGNNQEYKVSDEITAKSIVYNVEEPKRLPRTGY